MLKKFKLHHIITYNKTQELYFRLLYLFYNCYIIIINYEVEIC